jgi:outer membrane lipoprotein carrier protein
MVRNLTTVFAVVIAAGACGGEPQPAVEPQPAPPAAVPDTTWLPAAGDTTATGAVTGTESPSSDAGAPSFAPQTPAGGTVPPAAAAPTQPDGAAEPAGQPRDGAAVLRRAAAAYEGVRSMRADFVMNFTNPLLRQQVTSRGTIYQRQPDRIALRFSDPDGDMIIGDGEYFWVYYPSNNAQQVVRAPAAAAGESAVNLQAQFIGNPVERFEHTLEGTESVGGRMAHVLMLVPRQRAEYRSLRVWLDDRDALARRFEITEHNGAVRRFDLANLAVNPAIPDAVFRFTPPAGANIVTPR